MIDPDSRPRRHSARQHVHDGTQLTFARRDGSCSTTPASPIADLPPYRSPKRRWTTTTSWRCGSAWRTTSRPGRSPPAWSRSAWTGSSPCSPSRWPTSIVLRPCSLNGHAGTTLRHPVPGVRPGRPSACAARTCPRCCARSSRAAGSASRPGSAARAIFALVGKRLRPLAGRTRPRSAGSRGPSGCRFAVFWVVQIGADRARHGHAAPLRELGRAARPRRRAGAADLGGGQGRRPRPAAAPALEAGLGRRLLEGLLPRR